MKTHMISSKQTQFGRTAIAVFAAGLLYFSSGCGETEKEKEPVVSVQTTPAQKAPISEVISGEAVVFPVEQAIIAPKITSTVTEFKVNRGSHVKKGDLLAVLENKDLSAAAESTKGDYEASEAQYVTTVSAGLPQQIQKAEGDAASAQAAYDAAQKVYDARKQLFDQGAVPRRDLDSAQVALIQAKTQNEQAQKQLTDLQRIGKENLLKVAQGGRLSSEGKYRAAAAQLSYSEIHSPIDGVVTDRPLYVGDLAIANQPILTVMNTSRLIAKSHIPQSEAAVLRLGDEAELTVPGVDEPIKAKVSLVSPALDPGSTTIEVWAEARRPNPALKPGMTVAVAMTAKTAKDALVVPTSAVFKNSESGAYYVMVAGTDEKAHQKVVTTGIKNSEMTQVLTGVNESDPVIIAGGYALPDGTAIKVEAPGEKEKEGADKDEKGGDKDDEKGGAKKDDGKKDDDEDKKADKADKKDQKAGAAKPAEKDKE